MNSYNPSLLPARPSIKIKSESVKIHAAVALYNIERQRTPADDAGAPSPPAARSRCSSPLPLWTPIPQEIPESIDCPGPIAGRSVHDTPTGSALSPSSTADGRGVNMSSASAMTLLPFGHCDGADRESKAPAWPSCVAKVRGTNGGSGASHPHFLSGQNTSKRTTSSL